MLSNGQVWVVAWSASAVAHGKALAMAATGMGIGDEFRRSLLLLNERLRHDPAGLGEVYWSKGSVALHLASDGFLAIHFSIDYQRKFVLVRSCTALSGHGI